jgi:hypothetical protein
VRRRRYRPSLESGSERHHFILAMTQVQLRASTPCGLYSYILIIPSSSPVTRESSPAVKKKSAFVTQTWSVSFPSKTSLYGSSYIEGMRLKVRRQPLSSSTNLESNERKALHSVSNEEEVFRVRKEVTYTPTSMNATPTRRSSESKARTKIWG